DAERLGKVAKRARRRGVVGTVHLLRGSHEQHCTPLTPGAARGRECSGAKETLVEPGVEACAPLRMREHMRGPRRVWPSDMNPDVMIAFGHQCRPRRFEGPGNRLVAPL